MDKIIMTETAQILGEGLWQTFAVAIISITGLVLLLYTWGMTMNAMDNIAHGSLCTNCRAPAAAAAESSGSDGDDSSNDSEIVPDTPPPETLESICETPPPHETMEKSFATVYTCSDGTCVPLSKKMK